MAVVGLPEIEVPRISWAEAIAVLGRDRMDWSRNGEVWARGFAGARVGAGVNPNQKFHRGTALVPVRIYLDEGVHEWVLDRGAMLGVSMSCFVRDVLAVYKRLVQQAEAEAGVAVSDYGLADEKGYGSSPIYERHAGYVSELLPSPRSRSHLDDTPLGLEEV